MADERGRSFDTVFDLDVEWRPIAARARVVWGTAATAVAAAPLAVMVAFGAAEGGLPGAGVALILAALVVAWLWWLVGRRHRAWRYALREGDLVLRRGLLFRRLTIVPVGRMQFIDIAQGPLDRLLGLATVQLFTAAAASDAKVPLLEIDDASRLRDELAARGAGRGGGV